MSADTREQILEVAETAFAREGYEGAHLQYIASQVGVQKTALYYYFKNKAALYEAVLSRILAALEQTTSDTLDKPGSHADRLRNVADGVHDLLAAKPNYSRILIRIFVDRPDLNADEIIAVVNTVVSRLMQFFREGMDAGVFRKASSRNLFQSFFGAVVFHFASGELGAAVLAVEDLYDKDAILWRRDEMRQTVERAVLIDPDS